MEISTDERTLWHLVGCITQIRALSVQTSKFPPGSCLYQACLESYLVNYRLLFEFFDHVPRKRDFDARSLIPTWTYKFNKEAKEICNLASRWVVHFSRERLNPEEAEQGFPTDPDSLKKINVSLEDALMSFKKQLLAESPKLGKYLASLDSN